jgi:hypothetical protein
MMKYKFKAILTTTVLSFPAAFGADILEGDKPAAPTSMTEEQREARVERLLKEFDICHPYPKVLAIAARLKEFGAKKRVTQQAEVYLNYNLHVQGNQMLAACMYAGVGEIDTAIRLCKALMNNPETVGGNLEAIVDAFHLFGRPDLAIETCVQMITTDKTDEIRLMTAIKRLEAAGKIGEATRGWTKAVFNPRYLIGGLSAWDTNEAAEFFERHHQLDTALQAYNSVFNKRYPFEANLPLDSTDDSLSKTVAALIRLDRREDAINGLKHIVDNPKTSKKERDKALLILSRIQATKPD